jgi:hypothetical protein
MQDAISVSNLIALVYGSALYSVPSLSIHRTTQDEDQVFSDQEGGPTATPAGTHVGQWRSSQLCGKTHPYVAVSKLRCNIETR